MTWLLVGALVAGLVAGTESGAVAATGAKKNKQIWRPRPLTATTSVPGTKRTGHPPAIVPHYAVATPTAPVWPKAGAVDLTVPAAAPRAAAGTQGGTHNQTPAQAAVASAPDFPVTVAADPQAAADPLADPTTQAGATPAAGTTAQPVIHVAVADPQIAQKAGIPGVIVSVSRADGISAPAHVKLNLDYTGYKDAYGGDYGDRLKLVKLPDCVLTQPTSKSCRQQTQMAFTNTDTKTVHLLTAPVTVPGAPKKSTAAGMETDAAARTSGVAVFGAVPGPQSPNGNYNATSLKASDTWTVSNTGGYSYTYAVSVPPALGAGTAPSVALSYSSDSVDGANANSNPQASLLGDGWDTGGGFIEKTFTPCSNTGDMCQGIPNATISLPGHSGEIVHDDTTGVWRLSPDDGSRIEELTGGYNGNPADNNAYWRLTATDGTEYYFGANRLPQPEGGTGTDAPTFSAWGIPVYGTGTGTPCNDPTSTTVVDCRAGYRWNLDFVIDPHRNLTRYSYLREENWYTHTAGTRLLEYTAGGYVSEIDYGMKAADVATAGAPAAKVMYSLLPRCVADFPGVNCPALAPGYDKITETTPGSGIANTGLVKGSGSADNSSTYQDAPTDQVCNSTGTCNNTSPSFYQTARLGKITTYARVAGGGQPAITGVDAQAGYIAVDQYALSQSFAIQSGGTALMLDSVSRTGFDPASGAATVVGGTTDAVHDVAAGPAVHFGYTLLPNRSALSPLFTSQGPAERNRLIAVDDELGGAIRVSYDGTTPIQGAENCTVAPALDSNGTLCYPELFTKPGDPAGTVTTDWMIKHVATSVEHDDMTTLNPGVNPARTGTVGYSSVRTDYAYTLQGSWHSNDSEQTPVAMRTYDQFRGFTEIDATVGGLADLTQDSKTATIYLRGMDQDKHLDGTAPAASAYDTDNNAYVDDNAYAGRVLETETFTSAAQGAPAFTQVIDKPELSAPTAEHKRANDTLPRQRSRFQHTQAAITHQQVAAGTRTTEVDYYYGDTVPTFTGSGGVGYNGQLLATVDKADGKVPATCTDTQYATAVANPGDMRNLQWTSYPWQTHTYTFPVGFTMPSTPVNCTGVTGELETGGTQTLYDGAPGGQINTLDYRTPVTDPTETDVVSGVDGSGEHWMRKSSTPKSDFDTYGNALSATNADGTTSWTSNSPAGNYLPDTVVATTADPNAGTGNVKGWSSTTKEIVGRQAPATITDSNGRVTSINYDGAGRITDVWLPGNDKAANQATPNKHFVYDLAGPGNAPNPSWVDTQNLLDNGKYADSVQIMDGLGRVVQTRSTPVDDSNGAVVTDTRYDWQGRTQVVSAAHYDGTNGPGSGWLYYADNSVPSVTVSTYDAMGRIVLSELKDSVNGQALGTMWSTATTYYGDDRTDVTPPAGGVATSTVTDVRGRTAERWQYHENPPANPGAQSDADVTHYTYTDLPGVFTGGNGSVITVTDQAGNYWKTTDDLLGRTVQSDDPNAGVTTTRYLPGGAVASSTDARGKQLTYTYDNLGRKRHEYDTTGGATPGAANELAAWTYDGAADATRPGQTVANQPYQSIRYVGGSGTGGSAYTQAVGSYDAAYRPLTNTLTLPTTGPDAAFGGPFTVNTAYNPVSGSVYHYDNPAVPAAGLSAETVYNTYNTAGQLLTAAGNGDYLSDTQLTPFGEISSRTLGDYPYQVVQQQLYDTPTRRVTKSFIDATAGPDPASTTSPPKLLSYGVDYRTYAYDASGQVTGVNDEQNFGAAGHTTDLQCFTYDALDRLKSAWTDKGTLPGVNDDPTGFGTGLAPGGVGTCSDTTPTAADVIGAGPAPYWQDFNGPAGSGMATDSMGNRVQVVDHAATTGAQDITHNYGTAAAGTRNSGTGSGPHLLSGVATSGGATGNDTYGYDASGNTTSRQVSARAGVQAAAENLQWDSEGRLSQDNDSAGNTTSNYLYDAAGTELIRRDTTGSTVTATLYIGSTEIHLSSGKTTAQRYYAFPDAPTTVVGSDGTTTVEVIDDHGTGGTTLDATPGDAKQGQVIARRYTKPYGEARGIPVTQTTTPGWVDDHAFLGKPADVGTGLVDVGARKYDPAVGRFISVDPKFQPDSPQDIGGYAYGGNNPVNNADPTGRCWICNPFHAVVAAVAVVAVVAVAVVAAPVVLPALAAVAETASTGLAAASAAASAASATGTAIATAAAEGAATAAVAGATPALAAAAGFANGAAAACAALCTSGAAVASVVTAAEVSNMVTGGSSSGSATAPAQGTRGQVGAFDPPIYHYPAPDNWDGDIDARLGDATAHAYSHALQQPVLAKKSRTWVGALNVDTGDIAVTCSGGGSCAEPNIIAKTGWARSSTVFTKAFQLQDLDDGLGKITQEKPVCMVCRDTYPPENFSPGVSTAGMGWAVHRSRTMFF
ncbi:RHS repeat-associated core domain-containing protein [Catenulispora subtropica]|uniref:RHS repeat-associated core domain-containing protein n=1 Tax=Catenulispora subtropica TaxID=450798 RepID=A0ABN2R0X2_9ACTN